MNMSFFHNHHYHNCHHYQINFKQYLGITTRGYILIVSTKLVNLKKEVTSHESYKEF